MKFLLLVVAVFFFMLTSQSKYYYKCGYVAIIGKPNVGKSTLLNRLLGEHLSITSPKPQTTRLTIKGIYTDDRKQIIFLDTPGFLKPRYEMQKRMLNQLKSSLKDADVVLYMSEIINFPTDYDNDIWTLLKQVKQPIISVINKIDLSLSEDFNKIKTTLPFSFDRVLFISALTGKGIEEIIPTIEIYLPENPPLYDSEQLSDKPLRYFAQESIREGIFHIYSEEIPYASAVLIDKYEENNNKIIIHATIWIEKESQKPIIIGKNGNGLKSIREYAEKKFSEFVRLPVQIHLWVKVKKNWRKSPNILNKIGFIE